MAEVIAHGLRDPIVRGKVAADYEIARDGTLELAALAGGSEEQTRRRRALASLIVATIDGLSLQIAADPQAVDLDATFAILAEMVRLWLEAQGEG